MKRAFLLKHEIREVFFTQKIALKERFPGSSCEGLCPRNCCQFQPNIIYTCTLSTNSLHHAQLLWAPTRHLQRNLRSWLVGDPLCTYKHFIYTTPTIFPQSVYKYFQLLLVSNDDLSMFLSGGGAGQAAPMEMSMWPSVEIVCVGHPHAWWTAFFWGTAQPFHTKRAPNVKRRSKTAFPSV